MRSHIPAYPTSILRNGTTDVRPQLQPAYPDEGDNDHDDTKTKDEVTTSATLVYTLAAGVMLTILGALIGSLCFRGLCGRGGGAILPAVSSTTGNQNSDSNLVFNGNFNGGLSGWKREWQVESGTGADARVGNDLAFGGRLSQTIPVVPHQKYQLSASLLVRGDVNEQPKIIRGGAMMETITDPVDAMYLNFDYDVVATTATAPNDASFQNVSLSFDAGSSTRVTIFFEVGNSVDATQVTSDHFLVVDNVVLLGPRSPDTYIDPFSVFDWSGWDIAGEHPVQPFGHLRFTALSQCSPYEDGCAHVATTQRMATTRRSIRHQFESLRYTATVRNLMGEETIVTQWLLDDGSPVVTLYVSDVSQDAPNFFMFQDPVNETRWLNFLEVGGDGVANNGILDLFVVFQDPITTDDAASCSSRRMAQSYSGRFPENVVHVGTLQSGDKFELYGENDHGNFLFNITIGGATKTVAYSPASRRTESPYTVMFGSYDQARDMETLYRALSCEKKESLSAMEQTELLLRWYSSRPQRESTIDFARVDYHRVFDNSSGDLASVDLVFNGDFHLRMSGWRQVEQVQWTSNGVPTTEPDDVSLLGEPLYFAARVGYEGDPGGLSQTIKVVPEQEYVLSAVIAVVDGKQGEAGVSLCGLVSKCESHDSVETHYFNYTNTTDAFQHASMSFNSGSSEYVTIFFDAGKFGSTLKPVGDLIIDNVALVGLPSFDFVEPFSVFDWSVWEIDGEQPIQPDGTLVFDATEKCTLFPGGDGCVHAVRTAQTALALIGDQFESLSYTATLDLSSGIETIVTHWAELATVYVSDVSEDAPNFFTDRDPINGTRWLSFSNRGGDGVANNGVFDVFVVFRHPSLTNAATIPFCASSVLPKKSYSGNYEEHVVHLGVLGTGETFNFYGENNHGNFLVNITTDGVTKTGTRQTAPTIAKPGLLFGSYDQARDMETLGHLLSCEDKDSLSVFEQSNLFSKWYESRPERKSSIRLSDVSHVRVVDGPPAEAPLPLANLVFNGNFNQHISGWRPGGQAIWTGMGVPTTKPDATDSKGNPVFFAGKVEADDYGRLSQTIDVLPNQDYELTAMIAVQEGKRGQAGVTLGGSASLNNVASAAETLFIHYSSSTTNFQPTALLFNSGDSKKVTVFFDAGELGNSNSIVGQLVFDNVELYGPLPEFFFDPFTLLDWSQWEIDGELPVSYSRNPTVTFDAVARCSLLLNGDGCIHGAETPQNVRSPIDGQFESISYHASMDLSVGVETVITRWLDVAEIVVADVSEDAPNFFTDQDPVNGTRWLSFSEQGGDGVANNRIFDVFVVFRDLDTAKEPDESFCTSGILPKMSFSGLYAETVVHLGVIQAGEIFEFYGENDHGELLLNFTVDSETKTAARKARKSISTSSLQFGSYDQARDMETLERLLGCNEKDNISTLERRKLLADWYATIPGGRRSALFCHNVNHIRVVDSLPTESPVGFENLVFNGNFDERFSGWMQAERSQWSWLIDEDGFLDELDSEDNSKHEAGRVGDDVGRLSQRIAVVPNKDYILTATISVKTSHAGKAGLAFGGAAASIDTETPEILFFDYTNATDDFQDVTLFFNSGVSEHVTIFFDIGEASETAIGHLLFDNVVLAGPVPENFTDPFSVFDWSGWEIEGEHPVVSSTVLRWDTPEMCVVHKDGCMHAARLVTTPNQDPPLSFLETLKYTATIDMSKGAETIVTGWLGVASLYVSDQSENATNFFTHSDDLNGTRWLSFSDHRGDGVANNGVFDVFLVFRNESSNTTTASNCTTRPEQSYTGHFTETVEFMGTLTSGDSFDFYGQNDGGEFLFEVTVSGKVETATWSSNSPSTTLWFGSFDQAKDAETLEPALSCEQRNTLSVLDQSKLLRNWYADQPERRSAVEMFDVVHTRIDREA